MVLIMFLIGDEEKSRGKSTLKHCLLYAARLYLKSAPSVSNNLM